MNVVLRRWQVQLPAVLETLGLIRSGLRRWLAVLDWPADEALDILLAVNEAVANAVEHAFLALDGDGTVQVSAEVEHHDEQRRIRVRVRDTGRWLPRPSPEEYVNRRRGLPMMFALMAEVWIHRGGVEIAPPPPEVLAQDAAASDGTVVTMFSPLVPVPIR